MPSIGCYNDQTGAHPVNVTTIDSSSMTVELCTQYCTLLGYTLVGLTGHTTPSVDAYCYCGSSISPGTVSAPSSDCSMPCPGGGSGTCGGNYRMALYNTTCTPPLPPPGPPLSGPACSQPESVGWPFCNKSLDIDTRVADLVSRISLAEAGPQLTARQAPAIPRLGVASFYWGTNMIHGITNAVTGGELCLPNGRCPTIWPEGPALGATWNRTTWRTMGRTSGIEIRALNNVNWNPVAGMDGLTSWGPTSECLSRLCPAHRSCGACASRVPCCCNVLTSR